MSPMLTPGISQWIFFLDLTMIFYIILPLPPLLYSFLGGSYWVGTDSFTHVYQNSASYCMLTCPILLEFSSPLDYTVIKELGGCKKSMWELWFEASSRPAS